MILFYDTGWLESLTSENLGFMSLSQLSIVAGNPYAERSSTHFHSKWGNDSFNEKREKLRKKRDLKIDGQKEGRLHLLRTIVCLTQAPPTSTASEGMIHLNEQSGAIVNNVMTSNDLKFSFLTDWLAVAWFSQQVPHDNVSKTSTARWGRISDEQLLCRLSLVSLITSIILSLVSPFSLCPWRCAQHLQVASSAINLLHRTEVSNYHCIFTPALCLSGGWETDFLILLAGPGGFTKMFQLWGKQQAAKGDETAQTK